MNILERISDWWYYVDENVKAFLIVFFLVAIVFGSVFGLCTIIDKTVCYDQTVDIGYPSRWGAFSSCMIEVEEGTWIPLANYQYIETED